MLLMPGVVYRSPVNRPAARLNPEGEVGERWESGREAAHVEGHVEQVRIGDVSVEEVAYGAVSSDDLRVAPEQ